MNLGAQDGSGKQYSSNDNKLISTTYFAMCCSAESQEVWGLRCLPAMQRGNLHYAKQ